MDLLEFVDDFYKNCVYIPYALVHLSGCTCYVLEIEAVSIHIGKNKLERTGKLF